MNATKANHVSPLIPTPSDCQARTRGIQTRMCFERMRHAATAKTERALAGKIFFQVT